MLSFWHNNDVLITWCVRWVLQFSNRGIYKILWTHITNASTNNNIETTDDLAPAWWQSILNHDGLTSFSNVNCWRYPGACMMTRYLKLPCWRAIWWWAGLIMPWHVIGSRQIKPECWQAFQQSGTKPNLVAKIWPPNLVTIYTWLPKLVANVSSNFHHLVNTGLAVDSFFQMATNNGSPHLQIRHNLSGLYLADWKWLHPIVIAFNTLCLVKFYIQWCWALQWTRWRSYLKQLICSCLAS